MNVLHLSAFALIVMLWFPTGAQAHCDGVKHAGDHRHCSGKGGDDSSQVIGVHDDGSEPDPAAPLWAPTDAVPTCVLQKGPAKSLSGAFPRHAVCATLVTTGDPVKDDIIIIIDTDRRGVVLSVQVQGQDIIGADGIVYITDLMIPESVGQNFDGNMVIHVHADNVNIYRCDTHILKQKSICDTPSGIFALDDLVYSLGP